MATLIQLRQMYHDLATSAAKRASLASAISYDAAHGNNGTYIEDWGADQGMDASQATEFRVLSGAVLSDATAIQQWSGNAGVIDLWVNGYAITQSGCRPIYSDPLLTDQVVPTVTSTVNWTPTSMSQGLLNFITGATTLAQEQAALQSLAQTPGLRTLTAMRLQALANNLQ